MNAVDLYCERLAAGVWGEPLNTATNLVFFLVAWLGWRRLQAAGAPKGPSLFLAGLIAAFGVGSTLFHTFANSLTRWLDAIPIGLFVAAYLWIYIREGLSGSARVASIGAGVFIAAAIVARQFPSTLNGSIIYAPALLLIFGLGFVHLMVALREPGALLSAAGVLLAALVARSFDNALCDVLPSGSHFVWHLLTGFAIYLAMRGLAAMVETTPKRGPIRNLASADAAARHDGEKEPVGARRGRGQGHRLQIG